MWLADISIRRPVFATMIIMGLVTLGFISYPAIGVDLFPRVEFPIVNITTQLKGASPEVMDIDVTDRIEEAVNTINGVKSIVSTSVEGRSTVIVEFQLERDIDMAAQDVREKVAAVRSKLPRDITEPVIEKVDPDSTPVIWLGLSGERSVRDLSTYADEILKAQLQKVTGVGAIRVIGTRLRQIRVWLSAERMRAYGLTAHDVVGALQLQNVELPGGRIEGATREYTVQIKGELRDADEFNNLIVGYKAGAPVRVRDIGRAEDGMEERRSYVRRNGVPAVGLGIQKQSGTNTVEVIRRVKEEVDKLRPTLPPGMSLDVSFDQSTFILRSVKEVQHHLIYGGLLATLAVFIFLRSWRITLISALAIPTSIISTFAIMRAFDFTFNNMTMLGLTLSIGILIDDAIIVIENIHRHMENGEPARVAAGKATDEIGMAVMATTLAIIVIFLPVAFMKGIIGMFFASFALTVVFAVAVSLLVSFSLTPMLSAMMLRPGEGHGESAMGKAMDRVYSKLELLYERALGWALSRRLTVVIAASLIMAASFGVAKHLGKDFVPQEDQSRFIVRLECPIDYSVDRADQLFKKGEEIVRALPEVDMVFYLQGLSGDTNRATVVVGLVPRGERKRSQMEIMTSLRKEFAKVPGLKGTAEMVSLIGGGMRNVPIQYNIRGTDLKALSDYSEKVIAEFTAIPGVVDVDTSMKPGKPQINVTIDRDRAADLGLDVNAIVETINFLVSGEYDVTKFKDAAKGRRYDVRMRLEQSDRVNPDDLGRLMVRARDGRLVELASVVHMNEGGGPAAVNRVDRMRAVTVFANLDDKPLGEAMDQLNAISARILPPDMNGVYKGAGDTMKESFQYMAFAVLLGIVLAYMVLAAQYESFIHPLTVLLSLPLSFVGAFGALWLMGMTLSIFSFIGLILLMGLVKKNAILLVDYTNTLRHRDGMPRREALMKAGPVRLRPILMTTVAMIFGMLPVALGFGEGSETRAPMAVVTIGGLITSLLLTLVVVPVAYDIFDEWKEKLMARLVGAKKQ